jgi:hypothetical protein
MRSDRLLIVAFGITAAAFLCGVGLLFYLRTEAGDIYPPYSSLRADPLGSRALYESLESLNGIRVSRNYAPLARLHSTGAMFYLGSSLTITRREQDDIERLANGGSRVIIAFTPVTGEEKIGLPWHLGVGYARKRLHFQTPGDEWVVMAKRGGFPILVERPFGRGSIVLSADSYRFSNEAMLRDRESAVLSHIIGDTREIVFDESHLGTEEEVSVGALARRYHLQGAFLAGLVVVVLFLWKSTSSFLPPLSEPDHSDAVSGRSAASGLVNLLKRSVTPKELLTICSAEWKKTSKLTSPSKLQRIQDLLNSGSKDALRTYQAVHQILKERH